MEMPMDHTMPMAHNSTVMHDHDHDMGNSTMDHSDHGRDHDSHSMMHMWFYFGITHVTILFESWTINTAGGMVGACIGVIILAMMYEGLKVLRESLLNKTAALTKRTSNRTDYPNVDPLMDSTVLTRSGRSTIWSWWHLLQTFLHFLQVMISYALMLIFMTYNGYLAISILIGATLGYFVFGWKKAVIVDINEHCH
uniref:high affinity copper uptake protein 1-like n=1 Tax=Styela clava TaxID=7725 RepID=UPI0019393109|nr:high affinity copper uptake protein 1-like [Styela clava]